MLDFDSDAEEAAIVPDPNPVIYFDVGIAGSKVSGTMIFELYKDAVPKTVENFRCLCTGERPPGMLGVGSKAQTIRMHYKGSRFHRIIPGFCIQGGDIHRGNGTSGISIYGPTFEDESFNGKAGTHTGEGCLSMANTGPDTNSSQFFICLDELSQLDGKHVVIGRLINGVEILRQIAKQGSKNGIPRHEVKILDCGQVAADELYEEKKRQ